MKNQRNRGVRDMAVKRSPRDKGLVATIEVSCYDNGKWSINGDPCSDDLTAARLTAMCLEALADARTNLQGRWLPPSGKAADSRRMREPR